MRTFFLISALAISTFAYGQKSKNYIYWSKERRLQQSDFQIKTAADSALPCFAQINFDDGGTSFPRSTKLYKKIRHYLVKSLSWMDTSYVTANSVKYLQTLFDLSEINVRRLRKYVFENHQQISRGKIKIQDIFCNRTTELIDSKNKYDAATNFGRDINKQLEWEQLIARELEDLKDFSE